MARPNRLANQWTDNERTTAAKEVVKHMLDLYPKAPARTLARIAYKDHPELWPSLEACRSSFRNAFGQHGLTHRESTQDKSHYREPRLPGSYSDIIPEELRTLAADWGPFKVKGSHRTAVLSDIHFPFHSTASVELALDWLGKKNPTLFLLNGDIADCYAISDFLTDPDLRNFRHEVDSVKKFLAGLRKRFPKSRIIYKHGNHEERYDRNMRKKSPEYLNIDEFTWENVFHTEEYKVEVVKDKRPVRLGKLNVIHGHEYRFAITNPVNPARGLFLKGKALSMCGHFHQSSTHSEKNLEQKIIGTWSMGCLCDLHPEYMPLNNWNHGFAYVEHNDDDFQVENLKIIDSKVFHC